MRTSLLNTTSLLSPDHSTDFTFNVVKQVVENCDTIFTCRRCSSENPILFQNNSPTVQLSSLLIKLNLHNPELYLS